MLKLIQSEPAAIAGLVQTLVLLVTSFGLHLSAEQIGAINAATAAILAVMVRGYVTPTNKP